MKVLILGSGVIGTTTAYYLAKAGHDVTVIERRNGPALETSYANAGEVSTGYSAPWAGPGVPVKTIWWLLMHHSPLVIKLMLDCRVPPQFAPQGQRSVESNRLRSAIAPRARLGRRISRHKHGRPYRLAPLQRTMRIRCIRQRKALSRLANDVPSKHVIEELIRHIKHV